ARSSSDTSGRDSTRAGSDGSALAHEPLAGGADEGHRLGEQHAHRVAQGDRLLVDAALHLHLLQRRRGQLHRGVEGQRRELLALRLLDAFCLALGELAQPAQQILRVAPERESEASAFHATTLAFAAREPALSRATPQLSRDAQKRGPLYARSTSSASFSTAASACCIAAANGEPEPSPSACSSRREATPIASRYATRATRGAGSSVSASA